MVPLSIKIGWVESLNVFCAASETARNTAEKLLKIKSLPPHPLEYHMLPSNLECTNETQKYKNITTEKLLNLMEVYVDGFIAIFQAKSIHDLRHASPNLLHDIDNIFQGSVSIKKLLKEGKWEAREKNWADSSTELPKRCSYQTKKY